MCGRNVSLLSRVTPSVLIVSESGTAVPARSMPERKGKARRRCHKPNKIASDLFGFNAKPLKQSHAYMDERLSSSFSSPDWSVCDRAIWSWVSSAYYCSWIPKCWAMLLIEEIKIVNDKGPSTDTWDTPAVQNVGSDRAVPMPTCRLVRLRSPR